jgi:hypothetical protein
MRKIPGAAAVLSAALLAVPASAEDVYNLHQNQTGFTLPGVTLPQGQDEVRAADGTTCRSAVSGSGAYLDVGVIRGNNNSFDTSDLATYGRVVVPIGRQQSRLNCTRLYELEVERLQMELKLLRMGIGAETTASVETTGSVEKQEGSPKKSWSTDGWTTRGTQ